MSDDLTSYERRLVLGAMWMNRATVERELNAGGDDPVHIVETMDAFDSAARKLGGDPAIDFYNAAAF
jgi:hypothetical protein